MQSFGMSLTAIQALHQESRTFDKEKEDLFSERLGDEVFSLEEIVSLFDMGIKVTIFDKSGIETTLKELLSYKELTHLIGTKPEAELFRLARE